MNKVAVLGAGYMGSAITFPLSNNGMKINLWGTWLDDEIIKSCIEGYHPKLKKKMPDNVSFFYSKDLSKAIEDADIIFIGVTSNGFLDIFKKLVNEMDKNYLFFKLTKGLVNDEGNIKRISQSALEIFRSKFPEEEFKWTVIGGPVKAGELSNRIPTASIYAPNDKKLSKLCLDFSTDYYPVKITDDAIGVEVSSAFKNVYSIAIGICDGLFADDKGEGNYHNFNAFIFNQGMLEISKLVEKAGGRKETVFDLAGIGDFYVASLSGRNRRYGDSIGKGGNPYNTFNNMFAAGEVAEGYMALEIALDWAASIGIDPVNELPLLNILHEIIFKGIDAGKNLEAFVRLMRNRFKLI